MKYILPFVIVLQTYRASMIFLRKYKNSLELTLETLILFCLTFFELLRLNGARSSLAIEVILVLYITFKTNYEFIKKPKHISILSIKIISSSLFFNFSANLSFVSRVIEI